MRTRVLASTLAVAVVAVILVGVPLAVVALTADPPTTSTVLLTGLAGAVLALGAATGMALLQARVLRAPLAGLQRRAETLGSGQKREPLRSSGIVEVDRIAELLERSADRVDRLIAAERQFASDASHQLRTPLTALSMRLEEILQAEDQQTVREEAGSALAQVERLATVVEHLLDNVRDNNLRAGPVPLDEVVLQQVVEWEPAFAARQRIVKATGTRGLVALATPNGLSQVLATLAGEQPDPRCRHGHRVDPVDGHLARGRGHRRGTGRPGPSWERGSSSGRSAADEAPVSAWPWPGSWPRPTAAGSSSCSRSRRCSRCSSAQRVRVRADGLLLLDGREDPPPVRPEPERRAEGEADDVGGDVVGQRLVKPRA